MIGERNHLVVPCDGALLMPRGEEIRSRLLDALATGSGVEIDCREATEVDLSFLQIVIAAFTSACRRGVSFAIRARPSGPLFQALDVYGLGGTPAFSSILHEERH